eukprot:TRINITY_DN24180_c0_g1_i1.p1 TRINITY_DN24180_c0_g1~~TRINITY_DN24180_c0_g1_i1.p1  ORF type:complete len:407 (-),score=71.37 TRINITY_DN24180_c0_g1_i1:216-1436(-)
MDGQPTPGAAIVKLNVGGIQHTAARSTLTKYSDSMLGAMFSGKFGVTTDDEGRAFIDRDGKLFDHVLSFLRNGQWLVPSEPVLVERLRLEAEFFGLPWPEPTLVLASVRLVLQIQPEDYDDDRSPDILNIAAWNSFLVVGIDRPLVSNGAYAMVLGQDGSKHVLYEVDGSTVMAVNGCSDRLIVLTNLHVQVFNDRLEELACVEAIPGWDDNPIVDRVIYAEMWGPRVCLLTEFTTTVHVWNAELDECLRVCNHQPDTPRCLGVWNNFLISGGSDGGVCVWNADLSQRTQLQAGSAEVKCIRDWSGRLCVASGDSVVRVWDRELTAVTVFMFSPGVTCFAVWNDLLVTGGGDKQLRFWSASGELRHGLTADVGDACVDGIAVWNGRLAVANKKKVQVFDGSKRVQF